VHLAITDVANGGFGKVPFVAFYRSKECVVLAVRATDSDLIGS
jgi:hypothetical protein